MNIEDNEIFKSTKALYNEGSNRLANSMRIA